MVAEPQHAPTEYVLNVSSRAFIQSCAALDMDTDALLERANLTRGAIAAPQGKIPLASARSLFTLAARQANSPGFGARVADSIEFGSYQLIDFLAASAPTLGVALRGLARTLPLINPSIDVIVYEQGDELFFELRDPPVSVYAEFILAVCCLNVRKAMGVTFPLRRVELAFEPPADTRAQEMIFGCPVYYGADHTRWSVDASHASAQSSRADAALHRHLTQIAAGSLRRQRHHAERATQDLTVALHELLGGGNPPTLNQSARTLGVTPRTLQRKLEREHQTFGRVLDSVREELAYAYLASPELTLVEVALNLGFSEQSAFGRAFKRWTGTTPGRWRSDE